MVGEAHWDCSMVEAVGRGEATLAPIGPWGAFCNAYKIVFFNLKKQAVSWVHAAKRASLSGP